RHPLLAFVSLTFVISWSLWGLQALCALDDPISARWLGIIATWPYAGGHGSRQTAAFRMAG
ncbi:MAG: hypothetical protein HGA19_23065, partial [Oscillochloris sp.]|nr:hypothetical protein [Oscillochloris sp.]